MSKQEEAGLILKLYELRRDETMRNMKRNFSCKLPDFHRRCSIDFGATEGRQVSHLTVGHG